MWKGPTYARFVAVAAIALVTRGVRAQGEPKASGADPPKQDASSPAEPATSATPATPPAKPEAPKPEPPPRPPLPDVEPPPPPPWNLHLDFGPMVGVMIRPVSADATGRETPVRIQPAVAWGAHVSWDVIRYLRVSLYAGGAEHGVVFPRGSLGLKQQIEKTNLGTYSFGLRLSPMLPIGSRVRVWATGGVGWGRLDYDRTRVLDASGAFSFAILHREGSMVEFPLGVGTSVDLIPRWLRLQFEITGAFVTGQRGTAFDPFQVIDAEGKKRTVGGLPTLDASITPLLGLSMIL